MVSLIIILNTEEEEEEQQQHVAKWAKPQPHQTKEKTTQNKANTHGPLGPRTPQVGGNPANRIVKSQI